MAYNTYALPLEQRTLTTWLWNFGDGQTSSERNPTHIYAAPGVYTVTLTATNPGGSNTKTRTAYINVASVPVADFTATPLTGVSPLNVAFTDASTNAPTSWLWNFGDGATSTAQNPSHSYATPGTYTVTLTATNAAGSNVKTRTNYVSVVGAPVADFTGTPLTGAIPLNVAFTETSTNSPTSWLWDFGDGNTSTLRNPSHTYAAFGVYTVKLTATNSGGSNTKTRTNYVNAVGLTADFTTVPITGPTPFDVVFKDASTDSAPTSWTWDFGDGVISHQQNPVHTYLVPGTYNVRLTVSNAIATDTEIKFGLIVAEEPPEPPPPLPPQPQNAIGDEAITEFQPLIDTYGDPEDALDVYLHALGNMLLPVDDIAKDGPDGEPGWSQIFDRKRARTEWLPWMGQLVGYQVPVKPNDQTIEEYDARQRERIVTRSSYRRGTVSMLQDVVIEQLRGNKSVIIHERYGNNPYQIRVYVFASQIATSVAEVRRAALDQKVAGLIMQFTVLTGLEYASLDASNLNYASVKAKHPNYESVLINPAL